MKRKKIVEHTGISILIISLVLLVISPSVALAQQASGTAAAKTGAQMGAATTSTISAGTIAAAAVVAAAVAGLAVSSGGEDLTITPTQIVEEAAQEVLEATDESTEVALANVAVDLEADEVEDLGDVIAEIAEQTDSAAELAAAQEVMAAAEGADSVDFAAIIAALETDGVIDAAKLRGPLDARADLCIGVSAAKCTIRQNTYDKIAVLNRETANKFATFIKGSTEGKDKDTADRIIDNTRDFINSLSADEVTILAQSVEEGFDEVVDAIFTAIHESTNLVVTTHHGVTTYHSID